MRVGMEWWAVCLRLWRCRARVKRCRKLLGSPVLGAPKASCMSDSSTPPWPQGGSHAAAAQGRAQPGVAGGGAGGQTVGVGQLSGALVVQRMDPSRANMSLACNVRAKVLTTCSVQSFLDIPCLAAAAPVCRWCAAPSSRWPSTACLCSWRALPA